MTVDQLAPKPANPLVRRTRSEASFPGYDLSDSVEVARAVHVKGQGVASAEHLASYLGYKGTNNGAYLTKVGAARAFGLVAKNGNLFVPTSLAQRILAPVYPNDALQALADAFLNVDLFKRIYEDFKGKELPQGLGMKNALRNIYGVLPARVDLALRTLLDSADTAGFFSTTAGTRSHLILPNFHAAPPLKIDQDKPGEDGDKGGAPPPPPPPKPQVLDLAAAKAQYVSTLIRLFEAKSADGEVDDKLMERIERILGFDQ